MTQQNVYHIEGELFVVDKQASWPLKYPVIRGYYGITGGFKREVFEKSFMGGSTEQYHIIATTSPTLSGVDKFDWPGEEVMQCQNCDGTGAVMVDDYEMGCCHRPTKFGECCGNGIPVPCQVQQECSYCGATGHSLRPIPIYIEFFEGKGEDGKRIVKTVKY